MPEGVSPPGLTIDGMEGKQNEANDGRALILDSLEPCVPRALQLEGTAFQLHRRVQVVARTRDRVHAVIRGIRPYDVSVTVLETGRVAVACDCVTFAQEAAVCRHIWATLIEILNEDLLSLPAATSATS